MVSCMHTYITLGRLEVAFASKELGWVVFELLGLSYPQDVPCIAAQHFVKLQPAAVTWGG
jgi:hypothetical protein